MRWGRKTRQSAETVRDAAVTAGETAVKAGRMSVEQARHSLQWAGDGLPDALRRRQAIGAGAVGALAKIGRAHV